LVNKIDGTTWKVDIEARKNVKEVKEKVEALYSVPPATQQLYVIHEWAEQELRGDEKLSSIIQQYGDYAAPPELLLLIDAEGGSGESDPLAGAGAGETPAPELAAAPALDALADAAAKKRRRSCCCLCYRFYDTHTPCTIHHTHTPYTILIHHTLYSYTIHHTHTPYTILIHHTHHLIHHTPYTHSIRIISHTGSTRRSTATGNGT
jgi:hypothetical protein